MPRSVPTPIIIDTDPGVDDALAILLALRSPELQLVGLTTVAGNVSIEQATANLYRVLALSKPPAQLLIGQGAAAPIQRALETATHVHGPDGLGELDRFRVRDGRSRYPPVAVPPGLPRAIDVWRLALTRYAHSLTLITLGPLTNLALALESDPKLVRQFRSIICMAGAVAVPGNVTPAAEFNVYVDPHAARAVFHAELPVTLIPLDVTEQVTMTRDHIKRLTTNTADPVCRFLGDATGHALAFAEQVEGAARFPFHDPLAVAAVFDPSLVRCEPVYLDVETEGTATVGATIADRRARAAPHRRHPNVQVALRVNVKRALALFEARLCRMS